MRPTQLGILAQAYAAVGAPQRGMAELDIALDLVKRTSERLWEPEIHRLKGSLALQADDGAGHEAEAHFATAIDLAQAQQARALELRATCDLAGLWQRAGRVEDARAKLAPVLAGFSEGAGTADLRRAKGLLDALS